jgi:hypothetical protein
MTRPRPRGALAVVAAVSVAVALAVTLAGCSAPPPARTTPNAVERAAVQEAVGPLGTSQEDADVPWVQLWTVAQFPVQMQACAGNASHGQLQLDIGASRGDGIGYHLLGSATHPNEAEASMIVEKCRSATPVDDRVLLLGPSQGAALYSYDLTVLRPCLIAHGFSVGVVPPRDRFERLLAAGLPWSPYDHVEVASRAAWYAISDACPALPAELALWLSVTR